ncbi:hypothetical protein J6X15_01985 [Candidatus Saccharibacteria bacterium]|nr:hypothetical protein [Candidatus Saccharibacteria bacterium]
MNEEQVLAAIKERTGLSDEQVDKVNEVIEEHFIIGKDNKDKIIAGIKEKLGFDDGKADSIYNAVMGILSEGIANRVNEMLGKDMTA